MKKLKLDMLSSNELENKEVNQIKGGEICYCYCECISLDDRFTVRADDRIYTRIEPI